LELRHLHYIVASARNGSFSAAANELNVRQPIVSKRIKEVEEELGIPCSTVPLDFTHLLSCWAVAICRCGRNSFPFE